MAGVLEITPWILTWGDTVEVLEPVELRERMTAVVLGMAARYAPTPRAGKRAGVPASVPKTN